MTRIHYSAPVQTVPPTVEPLSVADARAHSRITQTAEDPLIESYIKAARIYAEGVLNQQLITATWRWKFSAFPGEIIVPKMPYQENDPVTTTIAYLDSGGDSQDLTEDTHFRVAADAWPAVIYPEYLVEWPATYDDKESVTLTWKAGYGDEATDIPETILQALRLAVALQIEFREPIVIGAGVNAIPLNTVDTLLGLHGTVHVY